jgi:glycosyltransferase involved in cell wall biosynthesis
MRVVFFANRMPDLCGAFLHDIDLATELQRRGHMIVFLTIEKPKEGYNGGTWRGFRFMHFSAGSSFLDSSELWICPHAPCLPYVRRVNTRGYNRPIAVTAHFDGRYNVMTDLVSNNWVEMFLFINHTMEGHFHNHVNPFPPSIVRTGVVRPLMQEDKIRMETLPDGNMITLVNANVNKGVHQFIELAKRMPTRKFLGVKPYYGELWLPPAPPNIEWVPFDDDIRNILKRTRILLFPSYYESFGRIAVEAMYNGIPVIYSKPATENVGIVGSTEGVEEWIMPAGIGCKRDVPEEWISAIETLDDQTTYDAKRSDVIAHVRSMDIFTEANRIANMMEAFQKDYPVAIVKQIAEAAAPTPSDPGRPAALRPPPATARIGFSSGRLRLQR